MVQYCMTCGSIKNSNNYEQCFNCSNNNLTIRAFNPHTGKVLVHPYNDGEEPSLSSYDEVIKLYLTTNIDGYKCYSNIVFDRFNMNKPEIMAVNHNLNYPCLNTFIDKANPWVIMINLE